VSSCLGAAAVIELAYARNRSESSFLTGMLKRVLKLMVSFQNCSSFFTEQFHRSQRPLSRGTGIFSDLVFRLEN
jgi:hypothetical protein